MTLLKKYFALVGMLLLCQVPLVLWLGSADLTEITFSAANFIQAVGKGAALSGITLYLLLPIISMRNHFVEYAFGGLDRARRIHKFCGKLAFYLILAHPVCLGGGRLLSGRSFGSIWDWTGLVVICGIVGFLMLTGTVVLSIYAHIKHQRWIHLHHILGWLIPVFLLHGLLANAQVVHIRPLLGYMVGLATISFSAFYYTAALRPYLKKRFLYEIADTNKLEGDVTELVLKTRGAPINYRPGQYAFLSFKSDVMDSEPHPFSFTTANNGPVLRFAIKALGDDTANVARLMPGTPVLIEGPYGRFSYGITKNSRQVWIAGGVGITPFLSMARSLSKQSGIKVTLFYATQKLGYAAFLHELFEIKRTLPDSFDIVIIDQTVSGRISMSVIAGQVGDVRIPDFFMCGPPPMMKALKSQLIKVGVAQRNIHAEDFSD